MDEQNQIEVRIQPFFIPEQSRPEQNHYVFAYVVRIHNAGSDAARLLARHWVITDGNGRVQEVRGKGVVGMQPYLKPGERFEYTSGAILETPVGTMQGSYQLVRDDGRSFDTAIPTFTLSVPSKLH